MEMKKPREAIALFREVQRADPQNSLVDQYIAEAEKALVEEIYAGSITPAKIPFFLVPEASLTRYNLTHEEGFVASRINGSWDLKSIVMLSPLREVEILQILEKLLKLGLVGLK
jgi:hypothetical protein